MKAQVKAHAKPAEAPSDVFSVIRDRRLGSAIAKRCGIKRQAISQWTEVPPLRVLVVSEITGMPPHEIRPDLYPVPLEAPGFDQRSPPEPPPDLGTKNNRKVSAL